jgi:hypothetical protein
MEVAIRTFGLKDIKKRGENSSWMFVLVGGGGGVAKWYILLVWVVGYNAWEC